jgi:AcrR family transcriptional regulator
MSRTVKEEVYTRQRNKILDSAQRLVYTKGFEQTTIQDILDDAQISKGAFYHYFSSKPALLEALSERMIEEGKSVLLPIIQDAEIPALEKLQLYFEKAVRWKTAQKKYLLAMMRSWYADENAVLRQRMYSAGISWIKPLLTDIICQGKQEGTLTTEHPEYVSEVVIRLIMALGDTLADMLLSDAPTYGDIHTAACTIETYNTALESILGAPKGALMLMEPETIREWFAE